MVYQWKVPSVAQWCDTDYDVTDPHQGSAPDCAFIAALSSLAWLKKGLISQQTSYPTTIPFYSAAGSQASNIVVDWNLCLDVLPNLEIHVYAHSLIEKEIWPAIYEKAYGSWKQGSTFIACSNYGSVNWGGNPCTALTHLTNKASTTKLTSGKSSATIRTDIRYKCYSNGKTKYPMVAWTYTGDFDKDPDDIYPAHSYSLLGLYPTSSDANAEIVLRNPFGTNEKTTLDQWPNLPNINEKGIFRVPVDTFLEYFEAYGYVVI